jgi:phage tail sheath protein FI
VGPVSSSGVDLSTVPILDAVAAYDEGSLLEVQQALITLCAARADAVAVLSVPRHYTTDQVVLWHEGVTSSGRVSGAPLSYAGFWHPWLQVVEPTTPQLASLRATPPDGTVCGTIAARENSRGVWVAPANVPIRGAVGLAPTLPAGDCVSLFNHHANLVVQKPGKFVSLSAHTLAGDPSLLQISVRRLLILIRKVALRRGMRYVFEPNTDRFRTLVRLSFERLLTALQRLGAFVDFQVDTGSGVNTADDIANGRLVVALRVAPTNPIEFITITLVRSGEGLLDVVGG